MRRGTAVVAVGLWACGIATGCGGERVHVNAVAYAGKVAITMETVTRRSHVLSSGHASEKTSESVSAQAGALTDLIGLEWLLAEARRLTLGPTDTEVNEKVSALFPGGKQEETQSLQASGETEGEVALEAGAAMAKERLLANLRHRLVPVTASSVRKTYDRERDTRYTIGERREVEITNTKTSPAAEAVAQSERSGHGFGQEFIHEVFERPVSQLRSIEPRAAALDHVIFPARVGEVPAPVHWGADYFVFKVIKIVPLRVLPLSAVKAEIHRRLASIAHRKALTSFVRAFRERWVKQTHCRSGYVVPRCHEYGHIDALLAQAPTSLP